MCVGLTNLSGTCQSLSEVIEEKNTRPRVYVSGTLIILRRAQHRLEQDHGQATRLRMYVSGAHTCTYLCLRADASMHTYTHIPAPHIHMHAPLPHGWCKACTAGSGEWSRTATYSNTQHAHIHTHPYPTHSCARTYLCLEAGAELGQQGQENGAGQLQRGRHCTGAVKRNKGVRATRQLRVRV